MEEEKLHKNHVVEINDQYFKHTTTIFSRADWLLFIINKAIPLFFFSFTVEYVSWFWVGRSEKQKKG